jgi:peptide/nickel transport system substrate-binding protein
MSHRWFVKPKFMVIVPLLLVLALVAVACGDDPTPTATPKPTPTATAIPATPTPEPVAMMFPGFKDNGKYGGIIQTIYAIEVDHWDLHQSCCAGGINTVRDLTNNLFYMDPDQSPFRSDIKGDLAKSWDWSADGKTLTVTIHEGAVWSDGVAVTAADVKFSLDRMVESGAGPRPRVRNITPYYASSTVVDDLTLDITTKFPTPPTLLSWLGVDYMAMVPKHILEAGGDIDSPEGFVGSGAYTLKNWEQGSGFEIEANPNYFKTGLPYLDGRQETLVKDPSRAVAAFQAEQAHLTLTWNNLAVKEKIDLVTEMNDRGIGTGFRSGFASTSVIELNFTKPPFDNPMVRKAIFLAIDRDKVNDIVFPGVSWSGAPFPPTTWFGRSEAEIDTWPGYRYGADGEKAAEDIAMAKQLMVDAGYADGFEVDLVASNKNKPQWEIMTPDLKRFLNITVNGQFVDFASAIAAEQSYDCDICHIGHGLNLVDPDEILQAIYLPGGPRNSQGFVTPGLEALFLKQAATLDKTERAVILNQIEDIIAQGEGHAVPVNWQRRIGWVLNYKVKNYNTRETPQYGAFTEHLWLEDNYDQIPLRTGNEW